MKCGNIGYWAHINVIWDYTSQHKMYLLFVYARKDAMAKYDKAQFD